MQRSTAWAIIGLAILVAAVVIAFLMFSQRPVPPAASPSASVAPSASAELNAEMLGRRWTVLFVGTDRNSRREAAGEAENADALLVASLSADQSQLTLVSLPRDTVDVPLPDGSTYEQKVNQIFAEQGVEGMREAIATLFDVPIDAHVVLDMDDLVALVDAVGTVEVNPPAPLTDPIVDLDLEAGPQELSAPVTLAYVRTRVDQDYGRMRRQQEVIVSLVQGLADPEAGIDVRALIDGLDSLQTDLPLDELPTLLELGRRAGAAQVDNLLIEPPLITFEGDRGDGRGYILEPDVDAIREEVRSRIGE
jgi:LCP family protein required for cell wall assembly